MPENSQRVFMQELLAVAARVATVLLLPILGYCAINLIKLNEDVAVLKNEITAIKTNTQKENDTRALADALAVTNRVLNEHMQSEADRAGTTRTEIKEIIRRIDVIEAQLRRQRY